MKSSTTAAQALTQLLDACRRGNEATVRSLLTSHPQLLKPAYSSSSTLSASHSNNDTPLTLACRRGDLKLLTTLFEHGAHKLTNTTDATTALSVTSYHNHNGVVQKLLAHGVDVNDVGSFGSTALYVAASRDSRDAVATLLAHGADANVSRQVDGRTPLFAALSLHRRYYEVVKMLLEHGANPDATAFNSETPLYRAVASNDANTVQALLLHGADVDRSLRHGDTPLYVAAAAGHRDVARVLLAAGALLNQIHGAGWSPGDNSLFHRYRQADRAMQRAGADLSGSVSYRSNPLCIAASYGDIDMVTLLLARGANVDVISYSDQNMRALHIASMRGYTAIVIKLLEHGADVNAVNSSGKTPLHSASKNGHADVVIELLRHGANVDGIGSLSSETPLTKAVQNERKSMIEVLLTHGASTEIRDTYGRTALHRARESGHEWLIAMFSDAAQN